MNPDPWSTWMSNIQESSVELCTNLRFCHQAAEFEKTSKIPKNFGTNIIFFVKKMQIVIKGALFWFTFCPSSIFVL